MKWLLSSSVSERVGKKERKRGYKRMKGEVEKPMTDR